MQLEERGCDRSLGALLGMQSLAGGWRAEQGREALSDPNSSAGVAKRDGTRKWSLGCLPFCAEFGNCLL